MGILLEQLTEYSQSDFYPYHMPGHKRQHLEGFPKQITDIDITEIHGFDNLHQPEGILLDAQKRAARAYGAEETYFLINGSTCGILSAVSTALPFGGHLLMARNCHKSVYHAAYLRQLRLSYIYPDILEEMGISEALTPQQVEAALEEDPSIQAVLIVSPTYEGRIADVRGIAEVVHKRNIPLIVDEAHGAHLGFHTQFSVNSARLGADLVINSVHKTLPAMTQTALLHCNGDLINREMLHRYLHIYQSSSPSYVLMASIDHAVQQAVKMQEQFALFYDNWTGLLERLNTLQIIKILPESGQSNRCHDIGKLILSAKAAGISGNVLAELLREKYHLEMEMSCEDYVLAMFTLMDTGEAYERMAEALQDLDKELAQCSNNSNEYRCNKCDIHRKIFTGLEKHDKKYPFWQAWDHEKKMVPLKDAEGLPAGEFINLYPPGIPIVVPGEVISRQILQWIEDCKDSGLDVQGVSKEEERHICVMK